MAINPVDTDPKQMEEDFGTRVLITSPEADRYLLRSRSLKSKQVPDDRYSRWCGGKGGFDDYSERLH